MLVSNYMIGVQKHCPKCSKTKPLLEFFKNNNNSRGVGSYCKICQLSYQRKHYRKKHSRKVGFKVQITTKICSKCRLVKKANCFYDHPQGRDGKSSRCAECAYLATKSNNEKIKYKVSKLQKEHYRKSKIKLDTIYKSRHRAKHPDRQRARQILTNAINRGHILRDPCRICNSINKIEAHHPDYARPLEVVWLCRDHHKAFDNGKLEIKFEYIGWKIHTARLSLSGVAV